MQFAELNKALKGTGLIRTKARCPECERVFDLTDPTDCDEWNYGHDCEDQS